METKDILLKAYHIINDHNCMDCDKFCDNNCLVYGAKATLSSEIAEEIRNNEIPTLTAQEALHELTDHFLGKEFYIVDPVGGTQANAIIVDKIKNLYPKGKIRLIRKD